MIDTGLVIGICIEYRLYTPLIYISTRTDQDFITPIVKMFSEYKQKLQTEGFEATRKEGYKCLWYLRFSLQGRLFPDEEMSESLQILVVTHLTIWMFVKENLSILIEIDPFVTFQLFLIFYDGLPALIIREKEQELTRSLHYSSSKCNNKEPQDLLSAEQPIHNTLIYLVKDACDFDNLDTKCCFHSFIAEIAKKNYEIPFNDSFESAKYLIMFPNTSLRKYRQKDQ
jgi:hypothetical protein